MGTLYLVATPIGNLEDISERALRVLREVDLIAAEDTRHAAPMLKRFGISTRLLSFHGDSSAQRMEQIVDAMQSGDIAVISDAGMPGISDPGSQLVRQAWELGVPIVPIPGPSAVSATAAVSGDADRGFVFAGFLSRKRSEQRNRLIELAKLELPIIVFEAPNRMARLLQLIDEIFPEARVTIGREITKLHEEWRQGPPAALLDGLTERGEFTVTIMAGPRPDEATERLDDVLRLALAREVTVRDAAEIASLALGVPKRRAYQRALELKEGR